uniref:Putative secreted protein n=1 Tax=Anopheles marajoara TaxID=58244 RepID=A0A2M4CEM0_9DIPT
MAERLYIKLRYTILLLQGVIRFGSGSRPRDHHLDAGPWTSIRGSLDLSLLLLNSSGVWCRVTRFMSRRK